MTIRHVIGKWYVISEEYCKKTGLRVTVSVIHGLDLRLEIKLNF